MPDQSTDPEQPPNVLVILTDEHRFDGLGAVNPEVRTPHLDALARDGVLFTHAYSTSPSCVPARAALITGRYPSQCGAPTYSTFVDDTEVTFTSLLRKGGYTTAVVGKQHFGDTAIERGYDHEDIIDEHYFAPENVSSYTDLLREEGVRDASELTRRESALTATWIGDPRHHVDRVVGARARSWLSRYRDEQPWYLCVSFPGPHQPFDCLGTAEAEQYDPESLSLPATGPDDLAGKPLHYRSKAADEGVLAPDEIRRMRHAYYANVTLIDEQVGRLVETLRARGEYENTCIVMTSDHGDFLGDFGLRFKGQFLAEALMRVPLVVKPSTTGTAHAGTVSHALVSTVDVAATALAAAGLDVPAAMAGQDLSPAWRTGRPGTEQAWPGRDAVYLEAGALRGVRTGDWKLVHYAGRTYGELYDLARDPCERHNLWDDPRYDDVRSRLYGTLVTELVGQGAKADAPWHPTRSRTI